MKMITYSAVGLKAGLIFQKIDSKFRFRVAKKSGGKKARPGSGCRKEYYITKWSQPEAVAPRLANSFILC